MDLGIGGLGNATEIGAGASAIVYRARQLDLDREVAVKVLSVTDEAFVRRFAREAKMLGKLSQNPGIVTVYDTGVTAAGQPYLILELCESSVLDQLQGPEGRFEPLAACQVGAQVADAVSDAHTNGVIHRDIKPGNVLKSQTGRYMITDFGISTVTGATAGQTNSVGFTAGYVAPETLSGETASTPADIYALGATLFHMLAGKPAFVDVERHSNLLALAQRVINDPVPDLREHDVPDEVCRIVEGAMAKRPQDRPTAAQLRDQLNAVIPDLVAAAPASKSTIFGDAPVASVPAAPAQPIEQAAVPAVVPAAPVGTELGTSVDPDATAAMGTAAFAPPAPVDDGPSIYSAANGEPPAPPVAPAAPTGEQTLFGTQVHQPSGGGAQPPADNEGGILNNQTLTPAAPVAQPNEARYVYADDRRNLVPLLVGAVIGFLALLGAGAYLVSQSGDEEAGDNTSIDAIDGSTTSANPSGNQGTGQEAGGGRGTLDPSSPSTETTTSTPSTEITIPLVIGQTEAAARAQLEALDFTVNVVYRESDTETEGTVVAQSPTANQSGEEGSTVSIFVATAVEVEQVAVPDLRNKSLAAAEAALTEAGLTLATPVGREFHPTVPVDQVISSSPTANITVNIDTAVALTVSDGPKPPACTDVAGLTEAAATTQLQTAGLTVTTSPVASNTVTEGVVVSCTANETSTTAELVISAGDVCTAATGSQLATATAALEGRGFTVTAIGDPDGSVPLGQVTGCTTNGAAVTLTHATELVPPDDCSAAEGKTLPEARTLLTGLGFTEVTALLEPSATVPQGEVISCTANAATAALLISSGPSTDVEVPDVVGRKRAAGLAAIRAADLEPEVELADSALPAGEIIATRPAAGTMVPLDSTVTVVISNGTAPTATVPDVVGMKQAEAEAAITALGLTSTVVPRPLPVNDPRIGEVTRVTPVEGTEVEVGSDVSIVVGVGPVDENDDD